MFNYDNETERSIEGLSILSLTSDEAMDFLIDTERFCNFELPEYFNFTEVLQFVKETIGEKNYKDCLHNLPASEFTDVNFDILLNKDGKYAVRPLVLCNPYLYYFLAREICGKENWETIKENFKKCEVPHIRSCAMPLVPLSDEKFQNSTTILNWWNSIEQRSIELSLDYKYMFITDITNCYGSINPQSIDWALSRKGTKKATEKNHTIANNIILYLKEMQQGRNIGIPQGSTLFHIVGEIVLCYADLLLHEILEKEKIKEYYILRYRDDYRIFCNNKDQLEKISYVLQQVLESLNFRMNSAKTQICNSIVTDSIKPDKLYLLSNAPIQNKNGYAFDNLQKHLIYILQFSRKFPNSGQLRSLLSDFDKRVDQMLNPIEEKPDDKPDDKPESQLTKFLRYYKKGRVKGNVRAMCAIVTQIALENIAVTHYALRVISRLTSGRFKIEERTDIIRKVSKKLISLPNSTYSQLWLQNITYKYDKEKKEIPYETRLCKVAMGEKTSLWNNDWLKEELRKDFPQESIVDEKKLEELTPIISFKERIPYVHSFDFSEIEGFEEIISQGPGIF